MNDILASMTGQEDLQSQPMQGSIEGMIQPPIQPLIDLVGLRQRMERMDSIRVGLRNRAIYDRARRKLDFNPSITYDQALNTPTNAMLRGREDGLPEESARTNANNRLIPYRLIDSSISREKPIYQQYLTTPNRIAIFTDALSPAKNCTNLEDFFTKCFRYDGSVQMFMKGVDISQLHGYGFIEVRYDSTKPGHFEFIAHQYEDVVFPVADDLSKCYVVYVRERYRKVDIEKLQLDPSQKKQLLDKIDDYDKTTYIDRVYVNTSDGYYIISYSEDLKDFISQAKKFYNGFEGSEKILNLFELVYDQNDELNLNEKRGRAFYDEAFQRSCTVLLSAFTEKFFKSSCVYGGVDTGGKSLSGEAKQLTLQLLPDTLLDRPITFFSPPEPTMAALQSVNTLSSMQASNSGQIDFAANNRKDSRKTATELVAAQQQQTMLSTVSLGVFSGLMSRLINYTWLIIVSEVAQGLITLPDNVSIQDILRTYHKKPAGDSDYVKRQEKIQQMGMMLPMIAQTPYASVFTRRLLELAFPDENIIQESAEESQELEILQALSSVVTEFLNSPNATNGIPPADIAKTKQLLQSANGLIASHSSGMAGTAGNSNVLPNAGATANQPSQPGGNFAVL